MTRVLVVLSTGDGWSRGILQGFMAVAHERGWEVLHYHPETDIDRIAEEWQPSAAVFGPEIPPVGLRLLPTCPTVSVNADRTSDGIASVLIDEERVAALALKHLIECGLKNVTTFRFDDSSFAIARERAFLVRAGQVGVTTAPPWWVPGAVPSRADEDTRALTRWLKSLPKPCGIFTLCDSWGRVITRYARAAGLRIPEDVALVGVDNDVVECELLTPPLSSVAVPWRSMGEEAASLVQTALAGRSIAGKRVVVTPIDVVARRSSDGVAIDDPLVLGAVSWIRSHSHGRITVPEVARAVASSRQRLERRFRAALGRTVQEEVRRARVETAKALLRSSDAALPEIARKSGFTSPALLSVACQREIGMPPGAYRRSMKESLTEPDERTAHQADQRHSA